jgi:hypothetical protein
LTLDERDKSDAEILHENSYYSSMVKIIIAAPLREEFETVVKVLASKAATRGVDALVLSWVKYEKQLRRLFCFLIYQHLRSHHGAAIDQVIAVLAQNGNLYPHTFVAGINSLGLTSIEQLVGPRHGALAAEIERVRGYRNKLIHGQVSGQNISTRNLERDVAYLIEWIGLLAHGAEHEFGYNGLRRNTYSRAKNASDFVGAAWSFRTPAELAEWLPTLNQDSRRRMRRPPQRS